MALYGYRLSLFQLTGIVVRHRYREKQKNEAPMRGIAWGTSGCSVIIVPRELATREPPQYRDDENEGTGSSPNFEQNRHQKHGDLQML